MKFSKLRENKFVKSFAVFIAVNMLTQLAFPTVAMALTSGPSTPEVQSFEPVGTTEMVDLFTGDFTYNIPLFELPGPNGGYPFNLAYHSGIGMDQEASWAGLGWNINPGTINRAMNGLPDDFKGDEIIKTTDMKDNITFGAGVGLGTELFGSDNVSAQFDLKIYYNNYKGVGYTFGPGVSLGNGIKVGVGASLDSQEGVGANASLSLSSKGKHGVSSINGSVGFNSRSGLGLSSGISVSKTELATKSLKNSSRKMVYTQGMGGGSSFSFAEISYTPVVSLPMRNRFIDLRYKTGSAAFGLFANVPINGFFSTQYLKKAGKPVTHLAYGYNYMEDASEEDLLDFNRSKDGVIRKESSNLAIPRLTYDYYNVMGQGVGGMYRPYRSDIGVIHDPLVASNTFGGAIGVDIGPSPTPHVGVAGTVTVGYSHSGLWKDDNQLDDLYAFIDPDGPLDENDDPENEIYESVYYRAHGEMTSFPEGEMDFMGGEKPVKATLSNFGTIKTPTNNLVSNSGVVEVDATTENIRSFENQRASRNMSVQPVTNAEMGGGLTSTIGEYQVNYYDGYQARDTPYTSGPTSPLDRTEQIDLNGKIQPLRKEHHVGGITSVNTDGVRYVYGLPAYNKEDKEYVFSVGDEFNTDCSSTIPIPKTGSGKNEDGIYYEQPNTNNYFEKTELPSYAYSYLLTSILGTDYVDVNGNGPDDEDHGYWVKFNYVKTNDAYQWRAPFTDANYNKGLESTSDDNTGAFKIGTKEVYHLATAETKTHIAVFQISNRTDGLGAANLINDQFLPDGNPNPYVNITDGTNSGAFQLDKISLFVKNEYQNNTANAIPIKEVQMVYDNSLCQGTQNAVSGKLTLKELKFTHQNNKRGELAPYKFDYNDSNPDYSQTRYDRWGNYKGIISADDCDFLESPYVQQFDKTKVQDYIEKQDFQAIKDADASAWHLSKITLPTGGTIKVDFEADDYAYVQNKTAQQMFKIDRLTKIDLDSDYTNDNKIYDVANPNPEGRVYFKLETPIKQGSNDLQTFVNRYIDGLHTENGIKQLYYKIKAALRKSAIPGEFHEEYISGYSNLSGWGLDDEDPTSLVNIDIDGNGPALCYTKGYITLAPTDINGEVFYHPFAVAAWQHMRTVQPNLLKPMGSLGSPGTDEASKLQNVLSLAGSFSELLSMFGDYRDHAFNHNFAQTINLDKSVIRLCSPDKKKYGGGQRVKKIELSDEWGTASTNSAEESSSYGQVYDYTMSGNGTGESSGIAQYEPIIGGDENAMRYAKNYPQSIKHFTDNNLFFEFPINESYFPAPIVGYRKVTLRSLATKQVMDDNAISETNHTPTTGISVSEFYTAKDYPVIVEETDIQKKPYHLFVPIPLIGKIQIDNLTASQGYSIILNDMHGKPKANTNYAITKGGIRGDKISSVTHHYQDKFKLFPGETDSNRELVNKVKTINTEIPLSGNSALIPDERVMGVEYEFFTDMRSNHSESAMEGLQMNNETIGFVQAYTPWPTYNLTINNLNTVVTNKVIHKAGILERTVVTDGQSVIETKNLLHDEQTGRVLLSSITNKSDDHPLKYKYDIPAHWKYEKGMGAAYKNYGLDFTAVTTGENTSGVYNISPAPSSLLERKVSHLVAGDEFVVKYGTTSRLATYLGESKCQAGKYLFYSDETEHGIIPDASVTDFFLYRSGRRNQLTANVSSILALQDPTWGIDEIPGCNGNVSVPECVNMDVWQFKTVEHNKFLAFCRLVDQLINMDMSPYHEPNYLDLTASQFSTNYNASMLPDHSYNRCQLTSLNNPNELEFGNAISGCTVGHIFQMTNSGYIPFENLTYVPTTALEIPLNKFTNMISYSVEELGVEKDIVRSSALMCGFNQTEMVNEDLVLENDIPTSIIKYYIDKVLQTSAIELSDNFNPNTNYTVEGLLADNTELDADAFQTGDRGIWRAKKSYAYFADREGDHTDVNTGDDGRMDDVSFFNFEYPELFTTCDERWKLTNEITQYNDKGHEVENKNILGIYSSAKYDGNGNLPILVASNAKYDEAYFESFEEIPSTDAESHTGKKSLFALGGGPISYPTTIVPSAGKKMILSSWIKWPTSIKGYTNKVSLSDPGAPVTEVNGVAVEFKDINENPVGTPFMIEPIGEVIEGWQKAEGEFIVPAGATSVHIVPTAATIGGVNQVVYFDDIRIFPADGNIKTFVYDPITFRLSATLDENNYASFYYYDESGSLFLIKVETAEGIKTIQESRNHISE